MEMQSLETDFLRGKSNLFLPEGVTFVNTVNLVSTLHLHLIFNVLLTQGDSG